LTGPSTCSTEIWAKSPKPEEKAMATGLTVRETSPARRLALDWDAAMALAATEYDRVATLLDHLQSEQWSAATDCPAWDVRAMAGHMLGMAQMVATAAEMDRQQRASHEAAAQTSTSTLDSLTALHVEQNAHLDTAELIEQIRTVGRQAADARRQTPAEVRDSTMNEMQDVGGTLEPWTVGYLLGIILTRDPFMHRIDIAKATGTAMAVTPSTRGRSSMTWCRSGPGATAGRSRSSSTAGPAVGGTPAPVSTS
jgi:uncharacterized protein (TIGR03083 family)